MTAYLISLKEAFTTLSRAREEALAELPDDIQKEEFRLRAAVLNESERWQQLFFRYDYSAVCFALYKTCQALAEVYHIVHQAEQAQEPPRPLNLKLGKTRPGFAGHGK